MDEKKIDYQGGTLTTNQLEVPPDLAQPSRSDRYAVPGGRTTSLSKFEEQRRTQGNQDKIEVLVEISNKMHIERAGSQRWLVVQDTPENLWPKLRNFLLEQGLPIKMENAELGIMETEWAENHPIVPNDGARSYLASILGTIYSSGMRDKYRVRIEKSKTPGTTEIYLSQRGLKEVYKNKDALDTTWEARPTDPELEAEMLRLMMVKLGATEERAKQILAASTGNDHARIQTNGDGSLQLSIDDKGDNAWRQVGLALDRLGLVVEDRDRAKNTYFVRYVVTEEIKQANGKDTWLGRLFSSSGAQGTTVYQVSVAAGEKDSIVRVLNKDGKVEKSESVRQILSLLYGELK